PIEPDLTLVAPFLAVLAAFAVYAQSVRFSPENGVAVLPAIAAAWLALRLRVRVPDRRWALAGAALLVIALLPMLKSYATLPADAAARPQPRAHRRVAEHGGHPRAVARGRPGGPPGARDQPPQRPHVRER